MLSRAALAFATEVITALFQGKKVFFVIPPTKRNLELFEVHFLLLFWKRIDPLARFLVSMTSLACFLRRVYCIHYWIRVHYWDYMLIHSDWWTSNITSLQKWSKSTDRSERFFADIVGRGECRRVSINQSITISGSCIGVSACWPRLFLHSLDEIDYN